MKKLSFILLIISALAVQCGNPQPVNTNAGETSPSNNTSVNTPTKKPKDDKEYIIQRPKPASAESEVKNTTQGRVVAENKVVAGAFSYYADAALFKICGEAEKYPVEMNATYLEMERAYLRIEDRRMAELIYANVEGDFEMREGMEGGKRKTFVPTKFSGFERTKTCE